MDGFEYSGFLGVFFFYTRTEIPQALIMEFNCPPPRQKKEKKKSKVKNKTSATPSPRFVFDVVFGSWTFQGGGVGSDQCYVFVAPAWAGPFHHLKPCDILVL